MTDTLLVSNHDMRMGEVVDTIRKYQAQMPDYEVFLDGDLQGIVARPRKVSA